MIIKFSALVAILSLVGCGAGRRSALQSAQEPHRIEAGPWFEGWYTRVSDLKSGRSVAVIVGSHRPAAAQGGPGSDPAYIGVLYNEGGGSPTKSWTFLPPHSHTTVDGQPVLNNPDLRQRSDRPFRWEADGFGYVTNDHVHIAVAGEVEVDIKLAPGKDWDEGLPLGPEGYLAVLPVPLHWYVKSLSAPAQYTIKFADHGTVQGEGRAHLEKNWGQVFPKAWNWLQGMSIADDAQIVLGGGTVGIGPLDLKAWLAGYRSSAEHWDLRFSDPGTQIQVEQGECQGPLHVHATRPDLTVDIVATAALSTFGSVAVPTASGFVSDFGAESFAAKIAVKTYRPGLFGLELTDDRVFTDAALEFGAASYQPHCSR